MAETAVSDSSKRLMVKLSFDPVPAAGYDRNLFELEHKAAKINEILVHAKKAKYFFPETSTGLNVGGQDSSVTRLYRNAKVTRFGMKDRRAELFAGDI